MQLRIVRRLSLGEVSIRVAEFEEKYGGMIDGLPDGFGVGQVERERFEGHLEWIRMVHALRAYGEGEDFEYYVEEEVELDHSEFSKLTPRRLELLQQLSIIQVDSINDLAFKIGRDVKNVYHELKILEGLGFVRLIRRGRRTMPELLVQEVTLLLV